ncbi:hypothetical protein SCLARK_0012 [Spiroplasma clarkii]|uniref:hypothetical protein n=1 Tax=Spiroplasma clarkii TaxID=2139 RepID=UPI000B557D86|nr:hypothetical protein [Spiroplasma clarkii]ARU90847.1 hypothetical protein SCLARK_0012 [Spiroplasma clarkii]
MRKLILSLLSGTLIGATPTSLVSCSWKVPPISVVQLSGIFNSVNSQVLASPSEATNVARVTATNFKMVFDDSPKEEQTVEKSKLWADGLTNLLAGYLVTNIQTSKNVLTGSETDYTVENQTATEAILKLVAAHHFTVRLSDIYAVSTDTWLSQLPGSEPDKTIEKTPVSVNGEEVAIQENNLPTIPSSDETKYSAIDTSAIWSLQTEQMTSNQYWVRYLFSFGPKNHLKLNQPYFT